MAYTVEELIKECLKGNKIPDQITQNNKSNIFVLRTAPGYYVKQSDANKINDFLTSIETTLNVQLKCIGGGYGCFELTVESADEAVNIIDKILSNKDLLKKAKDANIKFLVNVQDKRLYTMDKDTSANRSKNVTQDPPQPKYSKTGRKFEDEELED